MEYNLRRRLSHAVASRFDRLIHHPLLSIYCKEYVFYRDRTRIFVRYVSFFYLFFFFVYPYSLVKLFHGFISRRLYLLRFRIPKIIEKYAVSTLSEVT